MKDLDQFFAASSEAVAAEFERLLPQSDPEPQRLYDAIRWSLFGRGKRLRPALVFASAEAFGIPAENVRSVAAAVEMIHTYSLIHDDLPAMDDDDMRRGRATCHIKFDEATAILAGDALQAMAFAAIANDERLAPAVRIKLISTIGDAAAKMVAGQQMDLEAEGRTVSIEAIENIHRNKTGALIKASVLAGAAAAEAAGRELSAISGFGEKIGLLFQMTDDLLDVTESSATLGKTAGKDLAAEKATYPSVIGIEATKDGIAKVHADADAELSRLSGRTEMLRLIAEYIANRRS
jgi:geranylgeranyl pyrophosphate synthase